MSGLKVEEQCGKVPPTAMELTLFMNGQHHGSVFRVDVEEGGGPYQVLGQVAQQWHGPATTENRQ